MQISQKSRYIAVASQDYPFPSFSVPNSSQMALMWLASSCFISILPFPIYCQYWRTC